jgi:membrane fusion protein (multidrug efflux system)
MSRRGAPTLTRSPTALLGLALLALAACSAGESGSGGRSRGEQGTPEVGYVVVQRGAVPIVQELTGRTAAYETSEVRPQVSGVIRARLFTEGGMVRAGQTLYQIDPAPFEAAVAQARANLAAAIATRDAARTRAQRYAPLAQMEAVSQQEYTDAQAAARQAEAAVEQARAALRTAEINLNYTRVPAPISGRIGRSLVTVGALVTANQAEPIATIQRLDPIYVDIQQSSADLLALRRALAAGGAVPASTSVRLRLEDGSDYGYAGTVQFSEVTVDPSTGTVTLRARFPNPQGLLLPGMFVRAIFAQAVNTEAILVPQAGVSRDPRGNATVLVVGRDNKVVQRTVTAARAVGQNWVVTSGLNPGDRVITEGTARVRPGQLVRPVPAGTPQRIRPSAGGGRAGA